MVAAALAVYTSEADVLVMLPTETLLAVGQAAGGPMVMVKSLVSPLPKLVQASLAPLLFPKPRVRMRMPVVPCEAVVGILMTSTVGAVPTELVVI